jgi:hypothetical protein
MTLSTACNNEINLPAENNAATSPLQKSNNKQDFSIKDVNTYNGMLVFDTFDDFLSALKQAENLSDGERLIWESSKNFTSFGRLADELYLKFDFENATDAKEVFDFFETNSDKLLLKQSGDEITLSVQKLGVPERWIMNEKQMYVIGNTVYRHFDDNIFVMTEFSDGNTENINELGSVENWEPLSNNHDFVVYNETQATQPPSTPTPTPTPTPTITGDDPLYQPKKPSGVKDEYTFEERGNSDTRTRLKIYSQSKAYVTFWLGTEHYYIRTVYEIVNEKHKRWLGFLWYYWANVEETVNGSILVKNTYCYYDYKYYSSYDVSTHSTTYAGKYLTETENTPFSITSEKYSKNSKHTDKYVQADLPPYENAKKPWIYISGYSVNVSVTNGAAISKSK